MSSKSNFKEIKNKFKKNNITLNFGVIIFCLLVIIAFILSVPFSNKLEFIFKLKPNLNSINSNSLEVHFVDVEQGDAILIKLANNETILVDSGPSTAREDLLFYIDNIFFRNSAKKRFDYVILTHSDSDHSGNMLAVIDKYEIGTFYRPMIYAVGVEDHIIDNNPVVASTNYITYVSLINELNSLEINNKSDIIYSFAGLTIGNNENGIITFLSPNKEVYGSSGDATRTNKYSPMLLLEYNNTSFLLTGDAVEENEREVLNNTDEGLINLDIDVLKVAHHGSSTSSNQFFLDVIRPEYAVISYGKNNYGIPTPQVLERLLINLTNNGASENNLFTTYENGNIIFHVGDNAEIKVLLVSDINDYMFISWGIVIVIVSVTFTGIMIFKGVSIKKTKKKGK